MQEPVKTKKRDQEPFRRFMNRHRLDVHQFHVFLTLLYVSLPPQRLVIQVSSENEIGNAFGGSTEKECQNALDCLLARGFVQIITQRSLRGIRLIHRSEKNTGPVLEWPKIGNVDFTVEGAKLAICIMREMFVSAEGFAWGETRWVNRKFIQIFNVSIEAVRKDLAELDIESKGKVKISEAISVGCWRDRWWRKFSKGVRVDVRGEFRSVSFGGSVTGERARQATNNQHKLLRVN